MTQAWLGLFCLTTRTRGEGKCLIPTCEQPIVKGEQYIRINLSYGPGTKKFTKTLHVDCVTPWIKFMADRRSRAPENKGGRPSIIIEEHYKVQRKAYYRKLKYIVKKMETVNNLESAEKLYKDYLNTLSDINNTGYAYSERATPKRSVILSRFWTNLQTWRQASEPRLRKDLGLKYSTEPEPELTPERLAELDAIQAEISARVAKGYAGVPSEEVADYS